MMKKGKPTSVISGAALLATLALSACGGSGSGDSAPASSGGCPTGSGYSVGDRGPAGGWIFFVDSNDQYAFDYLEAAPDIVTLDNGTTMLFTWASSYGNAYLIGGTGEGIGQGESNTIRVANSLTEDGQQNRAVHRALDFDLEHCSWFLPSKDELNSMYINLVQPDIADVPGGFYWSSSEGAIDGAWAQSMGIGTQQSQLKANANRVWPVRAF